MRNKMYLLRIGVLSLILVLAFAGTVAAEPGGGGSGGGGRSNSIVIYESEEVFKSEHYLDYSNDEETDLVVDIPYVPQIPEGYELSSVYVEFDYMYQYHQAGVLPHEVIVAINDGEKTGSFGFCNERSAAPCERTMPRNMWCSEIIGCEPGRIAITDVDNLFNIKLFLKHSLGQVRIRNAKVTVNYEPAERLAVVYEYNNVYQTDNHLDGHSTETKTALSIPEFARPSESHKPLSVDILFSYRTDMRTMYGYYMYPEAQYVVVSLNGGEKEESFSHRTNFFSEDIDYIAANKWYSDGRITITDIGELKDLEIKLRHSIGDLRIKNIKIIVNWGISEPPSADFEWELLQSEPQFYKFEFTNLPAAPDWRIVGWHWDFGDRPTDRANTKSTEENPGFIFDREGEYNVRLIVSDETGPVDSVSHSVKVEKASRISIAAHKLEETYQTVSDMPFDPDAGAEIDEIIELTDFPNLPEWLVVNSVEVKFDYRYDASGMCHEELASYVRVLVNGENAERFSICGASSCDSGYALYNEWYKNGHVVFNNLDSLSDLKIEISHRYGLVKIRNVRIIVHGNNQDQPYVADFKWKPEDSRSYLYKVEFEDFSPNPEKNIVSWKWDFGDGSFAEEQNPAHQYLSGGDYDVSLTVTDINGKTASMQHMVVVGDFVGGLIYESGKIYESENDLGCCAGDLETDSVLSVDFLGLPDDYWLKSVDIEFDYNYYLLNMGIDSFQYVIASANNGEATKKFGFQCFYGSGKRVSPGSWNQGGKITIDNIEKLSNLEIMLRHEVGKVKIRNVRVTINTEKPLGVIYESTEKFMSVNYLDSEHGENPDWETDSVLKLTDLSDYEVPRGFYIESLDVEFDYNFWYWADSIFPQSVIASINGGKMQESFSYAANPREEGVEQVTKKEWNSGGKITFRDIDKISDLEIRLKHRYGRAKIRNVKITANCYRLPEAEKVVYQSEEALSSENYLDRGPWETDTVLELNEFPEISQWELVNAILVEFDYNYWHSSVSSFDKDYVIVSANGGAKEIEFPYSTWHFDTNRVEPKEWNSGGRILLKVDELAELSDLRIRLKHRVGRTKIRNVKITAYGATIHQPAPQELELVEELYEEEQLPEQPPEQDNAARGLVPHEEDREDESWDFAMVSSDVSHIATSDFQGPLAILTGTSPGVAGTELGRISEDGEFLDNGLTSKGNIVVEFSSFFGQPRQQDVVIWTGAEELGIYLPALFLPETEGSVFFYVDEEGSTYYTRDIDDEGIFGTPTLSYQKATADETYLARYRPE